jgi:Leucine-rich repeat (LRR) protein
MVNLECLNLCWNDLDSCEFVSSLVNLKRLNLIGNRIELATNCLAKLSKLQVLHMSQNKLKRIGNRICLSFCFDEFLQAIPNAFDLHTLSLTRNDRLPLELQRCVTCSNRNARKLSSMVNRFSKQQRCKIGCVF